MRKLVFVFFIFITAQLAAQQKEVQPVQQKDMQQQIYDAIDKVAPSVVEVTVGNSLGSGFYYGKGLVITNKHVIEEAVEGDKIKVTDPTTKEEFLATKLKVLIADTGLIDFAILRIDTNNEKVTMPSVKLGNSDNIQIGEPIICIGSPLAVSRTVTIGHICGLFMYDPLISPEDRAKRDLQNENIFTDPSLSSIYIQIDAVINHGNSGGPLINLKGEVIGINTLGGIEPIQLGKDRFDLWKTGLNYSIPINMIKPALTDVRNNGCSKFVPLLGFDTKLIKTDIPYQYMREKKLPPQSFMFLDIGQGPLYKSGIRKNDIVYKIDNQEIKGDGVPFLQYKIFSCNWNDSLPITVYRISEDQIIVSLTYNVKVGRNLNYLIHNDETYLQTIVDNNLYDDNGDTLTAIGTINKLENVVSYDSYKNLLENYYLCNYNENNIWIRRKNNPILIPLKSH